jgi:SAM-dependent methyltransferase
MNLSDLVNRTAIPKPWAEGEKIPWDDPAFSERMLREHLSQAHDAASRRFEKIDAHVAWIHRDLLEERPTRILDLGCGPGLYTSRLAQLGHECIGIDFSPASIAYARDVAAEEGLRCTYLQQDVRSADYGAGFDLVMFIYGELNTFRPADVQRILRKARAALTGDGLLLLEVSTFDSLKRAGEQGPSWYTAASGLFSAQPHLCLEEHFWDAEHGVAITRWFIVDAATGGVTRHAESLQSYSDDEYHALLVECGFAGVTFYPSLMGVPDEAQRGFLAIIARKG